MQVLKVSKATMKVPAASRTSPKKKRVRFVNEESNIVNLIPTYENKDELWFDLDEESWFTERDEKMAFLMQHMSPSELEIRSGESPRGMEHQFDEDGEEIFHRRKRSIAAVVETQIHFQQTRRNKDATESIAREYGLACERATKSAIERAEQDERFVFDHVRLTTPDTRIFEKREARPSLMGRQKARRSLE